ncbi:MAG: universal stress protein [Acidimicrobiia bacterium]
MAADGLPIEVACRVLDVSVSGYYGWLDWPLSARAVRHAWLTEVMRRVHGRLTRCLRRSPSPRRTHARSWNRGGSRDAKAQWRPTEGHTARTILEVAEDGRCDIIVIGSHGQGRFEGLLGSTGTKTIRHASADVLVIRSDAEPGG